MNLNLITAEHIYPIWYYTLGVLTTICGSKLYKKARPLKEIVIITELRS